MVTVEANDPKARLMAPKSFQTSQVVTIAPLRPAENRIMATLSNGISRSLAMTIEGTTEMARQASGPGKRKTVIF